MSPPDPAKKLASLLKRLRSRFDAAPPARGTGDAPPTADSIVSELVFSMLLWEAATSQARAAYKRLHEAFVDYNDLRAAIDDEVAEVLGEKYPLAAERARRLRAALNDIYRRQHAVSLAHLPELAKRDAKAYIDSIEGVPLFASHRLLLCELHVHALPIDERLRDLLAAEGVLDEANDVHSATAFIERHVHADEASEVASLFQAWSDEDGQSPRKEKRAPAPAVEPAARPAPARSKAEPRAPKAAAARKTKAKSKGGG
ncbi:MAG: hypothetical protein ACOYN0_11225 [Phycisphaerales bacterium]